MTRLTGPARLNLPALVAALALAGCAAPASGPGPVEPAREAVPFSGELTDDPAVQVKTLVADLDDPWGMDFLPGGDMLVTEQSGALKRVSAGNYRVSTVTGVPASVQAGQGGLLDVLVHPEFPRNQLVYLSYSVEEGKRYSTRVSRGRLVGDQLVDLQEVFTARPFFEQRRHFGSRLLLDGGYLYITIGDRGNRDLAQSLETHNGKVLRLTETGAVPRDNPFVTTADARPEIWTWGHRNPQGMAKHPHDGSIWVAEHGPQGGDEVNRLRRGANYGWPLITYGEEYGGGDIGEGTHASGLEQPLVYWTPSIGTGGIDFYTGDLYPGWRDSLLVAGMRLTRISRLELDGPGLGRETRLLADLKMRIRDVQVGPDDRVYALADGSRLIRLELVP